MGRKKMQDRFKTSEDAESRYEKLVAEIKRIHGELFFRQKLDGFDLKEMVFKDPHNVKLIFGYGGEEYLDRELTLYHKQPLFPPYECYDANDYLYCDYNLSEQYQQEVIKDIATKDLTTEKQAENIYKALIKIEEKKRLGIDGTYTLKRVDEDTVKIVKEEKEEVPF